MSCESPLCRIWRVRLHRQTPISLVYFRFIPAVALDTKYKLRVGAHGPGPPSSPTAGAGLPSTDVMDPAIPTSACGGEAYPNKDKAATISRSMAQGGEAYPNKDKAAAIWRSRAHGREAYPNKDKAAAMLRSREPSLTSVEVV